MAVTLRRTGQQQELPAPTGEELTRAREQAGLLQLEGLRKDLEETLGRFARGMVLYLGQRWEWEDPEPESDPRTWPPLPRLLWLYDRALLCGNQINWLRHFSDRPGWCPDCHPGEPRASGWWQVVCPDHVTRNGARTLAQDWGLLP